MKPLLRPIQKVSISPSLSYRTIQSIDILASGLADLNKIVDAHVERNPFLKLKESSAYRFERDVDVAGKDAIESMVQPMSLVQYLNQQLAIIHYDESIKIHIDAIINSLDENGYLRTPLQELAVVMQLPVDQFEQGLAVVQGLEPSGVGARSLAECFALQLIEKDCMSCELATFLESIENINTMSREGLALQCGVSVERLTEMIALIRSLSPYPGQKFMDKASLYVTPDIYLIKNEDSSFTVNINKDARPQVYFDKNYFEQVFSKVSKTEDKVFLQRCYADAHKLINDLTQRDSSVSRVVNDLLEMRKSDLREPRNALRPVIQRELAQRLGLHESTVSRTISNKFICYQGKTSSLQSFFGSSKAVGDNISEQIQKMIQNETVDAVLSDEDIAKVLQNLGMSVARRTVAKYRLDLNIPASSQRRQQWARFV